MAIFQRLGAEEIKFELSITIHFVSAKLNYQGLIKVAAKRGRDKKEETQAMQYDSIREKVIFEYPLNFFTTMYRKNDKYLKKFVSFRIYEVVGNKNFKNGKARMDISEATTYGISIMRAELPLRGCGDKSAYICVSIDMNIFDQKRSASGPALEPGGDISLQVGMADKRSKYRSAADITSAEQQMLKNEHESFYNFENEKVKGIPLRPKNLTISIKNRVLASNGVDKLDNYDKSKFIYHAEPIDRNVRSFNSEISFKPPNIDLIIDETNESTEDLVSKSMDEAKILFRESPEQETNSPTRTDKLSRRDIFVGLGISKESLINPKDSLIESEESSSEEEPLDLSSDLLGSIEHPVSTMSAVHPNERSQELVLTIKEERSGLPKPKETCCACTLF